MVRFYTVPPRTYSCLQWSSPIAGCTVRVVHQKIRKVQKCERVNVNEYLSQQDTECRKCALGRPSSPGEAKYRTRTSDFTTGHIGAYSSLKASPESCLLEHRRHVERLQKHHGVHTKARENSWRDSGRNPDDRRRSTPFAVLHDLAVLSLQYGGPAPWKKLV